MALALTLLSLVAEPDTTMTGYASKYAEGVFESVIELRIERGYGFVPADWDTAYSGYFAGLDCAAVGQELWARPGVGHKWERLLYADCSGHESTTRNFLANGIVGEVDWHTFERWYQAGYHTEKGMPIEIRPLSWWWQWVG